MARIVWLTDLHFEAEGLVLGHDPRVRLDAAVDFISARLSDADLCLVTGDVVETANAANYAAVAARLSRLPMPVCLLPGNHDDRDQMRQRFALPGDAMPGFVQFGLDLGEALLLGLDTLVPGRDHGFLCPARLDWVADRLRENRGKPVIVAMHHPPVPLGLPMLDPDNLRNGSALLDLLEAHDAPVQVLAGHVHRPVSALAGRIPLRSQRAVLYQAPAPFPPWNWDSFVPASEAPGLGLVTVAGGRITIQDLEFCRFSRGGPA